jgi:hypothetical protein
VVCCGTGTAANIGRPIAGKTGTAQDYTNVYFAGYTPQVATAVWVGFPQGQVPMDSYYGQSVYGGTVAAPIWHNFMVKAVAGMPVEGFPGPPIQRRGTIPNVVGLPSAEAQQVLIGAEFTPLVKKVDSSAPENTVLEQSPPGGATASLGSAVTLTVSNGAGKGKGDGGGTGRRVHVPDVTGMAEKDAVKAIEGSGLVPAVRYEDVTDPKREGIVLTQSPAVGERVRSGSTVVIVVGQQQAGPNRRL